MMSLLSPSSAAFLFLLMINQNINIQIFPTEITSETIKWAPFRFFSNYFTRQQSGAEDADALLLWL